MSPKKTYTYDNTIQYFKDGIAPAKIITKTGKSESTIFRWKRKWEQQKKEANLPVATTKVKKLDRIAIMTSIEEGRDLADAELLAIMNLRVENPKLLRNIIEQLNTKVTAGGLEIDELIKIFNVFHSYSILKMRDPAQQKAGETPLGDTTNILNQIENYYAKENADGKDQSPISIGDKQK